MIGAAIGAAIAIGSTIYSENASRADKRKAKKQLKKIAKASGVNYSDLKSSLDNIYSQQIGQAPNKYTDIMSDLESSKATTGDDVTAPVSRDIDLDALKARISDATGASNIVLDTDSNIYSSAIKDWQTATNSDYLAYATKLKEAKDWLEKFDKYRAGIRSAKSGVNDIAKTLEQKRNETLLNLDVGNLQNQANLAAQGLQYV